MPFKLVNKIYRQANYLQFYIILYDIYIKLICSFFTCFKPNADELE